MSLAFRRALNLSLNSRCVYLFVVSQVLGIKVSGSNGSRLKLKVKKIHYDVTYGAMARKILKKIIDLVSCAQTGG